MNHMAHAQKGLHGSRPGINIREDYKAPCSTQVSLKTGEKAKTSLFVQDL